MEVADVAVMLMCWYIPGLRMYRQISIISQGKGRHLGDGELLLLSEERLLPASVQCHRSPHEGRVWETSHHLCDLQDSVGVRSPQSCWWYLQEKRCGEQPIEHEGLGRKSKAVEPDPRSNKSLLIFCVTPFPVAGVVLGYIQVGR